MKVELPLGDVVDKVTILRIKSERIDDPNKRANVSRELDTLLTAWQEAGLPQMESLAPWEPLLTVNGELWDVEDALRAHERDGDFGSNFVALARSVYRLNDRRAALKRQLNEALGSRLVEEKSYADYDQGRP